MSDHDDPWAGHAPLLAGDVEVPAGLVTEEFVLEPLRASDNEADHHAWTSSIDHIRATPGFEGRPWPDPDMTLADNERDLRHHERDFAARVGFTYSVKDPSTREVIGCVYLYPPGEGGGDVDVRSWVRADRAALDGPLHDAVAGWIATDWPFEAPSYAPRP